MTHSTLFLHSALKTRLHPNENGTGIRQLRNALFQLIEVSKHSLGKGSTQNGDGHPPPLVRKFLARKRLSNAA